MLVEVELALDWYAPAVARGDPPSGARMQFLGLWREALDAVLAQPTTWTLRDYPLAQSALAARSRRARSASA